MVEKLWFFGDFSRFSMFATLSLKWVSLIDPFFQSSRVFSFVVHSHYFFDWTLFSELDLIFSCTFFASIFHRLLLSDFSLIPNLNSFLDVVLKTANRFSLFFSIFGNIRCEFWDLFEWNYFLGRDSVNMVIRGVMAAVGVATNRLNFYLIVLNLCS